MILIDAGMLSPELLHATLESLSPLEVEVRGETFSADGCRLVTESVIIFLVQGAEYSVPRVDILRIIAKG